MKKTYRDYLLDMINAMNEVADFTKGMGREEFSRDRKTVNAVIRSLEVLGEAAKKIPDEIREKHPSIPWKRIAGFRDKLIHEYFGLDLDIIWGVIQEELPPLKPAFDQVLAEFSEAP